MIPKVDVLVVNEFPNIHEHNAGEVLAGKAGYELREALKQAGLYESVAFTNLVRCRPLDRTMATRLPTTEEMAACANHVWEDIRRLKPKVVVLLGQIATRAMAPTYTRWHEHGVQEIAGETMTMHGVTFFPVPSPYLWAFDQNPYPHRKRLHRLMQLVSIVLEGKQTPMSAPGSSYYCGTLVDVKMAINRIRRLNVKERPHEWGVGLDTEGQNVAKVATNGLSCIQLAPSIDFGYIIPIDHFDSPWTPEEKETVVGWLRDLFTDPDLGFECWIAHESKFDENAILRRFGIKRFALPIIDPIFLEYLDDENLRAKSDEDDNSLGADSFRSSFNLKALLINRCNFRHYDFKILKIRTKPEGFWKTPMRPGVYTGAEEDLARKFRDYCGMDAYGALRLAITQRYEMDKRGYTAAYNLARKWGYRISHLMRAMEFNGVHIDREMLDFLGGDLSPALARLSVIPDEIYDTPECQEANRQLLTTDKRMAGMKTLYPRRIFDIRKKEHLVKLFVDVCGLEPVEKKHKKGKNKKTDAEKEKELPAIDKAFYAQHDHHPIVQLMQEYVGLSKVKSSYVDAFHNYLTDPKYVDNQFDGRLHASFSHTATFTGRLASKYPSIHQIPRGDNFAKKCVKSLIAAPLGYLIIEGDYAQAEVRWWAQLSGDKDFADMFWRMYEIQQEYYRNPTPENRKRKELECDVHRQVASLMFGVAIQDVTPDQRQAAKSLTFGCIYGQSDQALAQILKITKEAAAELQMKFIGRFKKAGPWLTWIEEEAKRLGYVETLNGRRRHLGELFKIDEGGTRRQARNSPIQAIASDVMGEAAYLQQCWIEDHNYDVSGDVKCINLVHDALLQQVRMDIDLVRDVVESTSRHMMYDVGPVLERDYGLKLIVPMVADFKFGLRWGHAEEWDRGESLEDTFKHLQDQNELLASGTPYWHIAVNQERKKAKKDEDKLLVAIAKAVDHQERSKHQNKLARHRKHMEYLSNLPVAA